LSRLITALENQVIAPALRQQILDEARASAIPVLGITGNWRFRQVLADG